MPVEGTFSAAAVIESTRWTDDFNRTVASGWGTSYIRYFGTDPGSVNGAEGVVKVTYAGFQPVGLAYLDEFTVQADWWMPIQAQAASGIYYDFWFWKQLVFIDFNATVGANQYQIRVGVPATQSTWTYANVTVDELQWYTAKFRRSGGRQRAKFWKRGDPEPETWLIDVPATATINGFSSVATLELDAYGTGTEARIDNFRVWSYETSQSFTASAIRGKTGSGSFTANANIRDTNDPTNRAIGSWAVKRETFPHTITADTLKRRTFAFGPGTGAPSISQSSFASAGASSTISLTNLGVAGDLVVVAIAYDAAGSSTNQWTVPPGWWLIAKAYPSDYDVVLQVMGRVRSDGDPASWTFTYPPGSVRRAGALFRVERANGAQIVVATTNGPTTTQTAHTISPGLADNSVAGAMLVLAAGSVASSWTAGAGMSGGLVGSTTLASLGYGQGSWGANGTMSGVLPQDPKTLTSSVAVSDVMAALTFLRPTTGITANAYKLRTSFTANAFLRAQFFTASAWKLKLDTLKTFTANAYVAAIPRFGSFTGDAVRRRTIPAGFTAAADLVVGSRTFGSISAGAWTQFPGATTTQHSRNDMFHTGGTPSDAILTTQAVGPWPVGTVLHTVLEWLWSQYSYRTSINLVWAAFRSDAVRRTNDRPGSFTAAGWRVVRTTASITGDASVRRTQAGSLTADAIGLRVGAGSFTSDAISLKIAQGSLTADALVAGTGGSVIGDAVILATAAGTFTADAISLKIAQGSLTADATLVPTFTANAVIATAGGTYFDSDYFDSAYFD